MLEKEENKGLKSRGAVPLSGAVIHVLIPHLCRVVSGVLKKVHFNFYNISRVSEWLPNEASICCWAIFQTTKLLTEPTSVRKKGQRRREKSKI